MASEVLRVVSSLPNTGSWLEPGRPGRRGQSRQEVRKISSESEKPTATSGTRRAVPRGRSVHPDGAFLRRVPSLLLRVGRGRGSHLVSAFQKVSRKSERESARCEQLKEKRVVGTSGSRVSGPQAYAQRVEQESAALVFELGPGPAGPPTG